MPGETVWLVRVDAEEGYSRQDIVIADSSEIRRIRQTLKEAEKRGQIADWMIGEADVWAVDESAYAEILDKYFGIHHGWDAPKDWRPRGHRAH